ncbi:hypothetical protein SNE40_011043 [Patella caerulea]|uniref:Proteasome inhibitor PI31 subunit n=2 Tax=Patella caerulea TaxID=87958 RepID=A0AAN8JW71_PATCE
MPLPGLELLYQSLSNAYKNADDVLVSVIHWKIISNGFKCIGKGEKAKSCDKKSEMLPKGWNSDENLYVLRYNQTSNNKIFILKIIKIDDSLMVNFMREEDEKVASMNIRASDHCTGVLNDYHSAFKNLEDFKKRVKKEIFDEFKTSVEKKSESRKSQSSLLEDDRFTQGGPSHRRSGQQHEWIDPDGPFSVGRGDLDPFGGMGGGMLMDPRRSGGPGFGMDPSTGLPARLPRGAVPPGARFDPFGPSGARPSPDPDHMRPPDYDDMFM